MDNNEFQKLADQTLNFIVDTIEVNDIESNFDVDFNNDVINIVNSQSTFVLNKQSAAKEIWLVSPISGPYHFYYADQVWQNRNGDKLLAILQKELQINFSI